MNVRDNGNSINKLISAVLATVCFLFFCYFFSGEGDGLSITALNPSHAINGIAFSFGFALGVPMWLSYILALLIIVGIPVLFYWGIYRALTVLNP